MNLTKEIKAKALELGFDLVGITDASAIEARQSQYLEDWLKQGFAAQMNYMQRNFEKRINPCELLENAQSVICVGLNYNRAYPKQKTPMPAKPLGRISTHAQYQDYHGFIKKLLRKLADFIIALTDKDTQFKICVDTVPLAERALAQRAGLGFIGKNHMLINPKLGSQIFLGEIINTLKLLPDKPMKNHCPDCDKCIRACPTGALDYQGRFDANKCISYLTIEHKAETAPELAQKIGDRLFGCDECVCACPYQVNAQLCQNRDFKFYPERSELELKKVLNMSESDFKADFADSPVERLTLNRLKANAEICLKNISKLRLHHVQ